MVASSVSSKDDVVRRAQLTEPVISMVTCSMSTQGIHLQNSFIGSQTSLGSKQ